MEDSLERRGQEPSEVVDRPNQVDSVCRESGALPLWLTEAEAEWLVSLCVASRSYIGQAEERTLFGKLGHYLREFRQSLAGADADLAA